VKYVIPLSVTVHYNCVLDTVI